MKPTQPIKCRYISVYSIDNVIVLTFDPTPKAIPILSRPVPSIDYLGCRVVYSHCCPNLISHRPKELLLLSNSNWQTQRILSNIHAIYIGNMQMPGRDEQRGEDQKSCLSHIPIHWPSSRVTWMMCFSQTFNLVTGFTNRPRAIPLSRQLTEAFIIFPFLCMLSLCCFWWVCGWDGQWIRYFVERTIRYQPLLSATVEEWINLDGAGIGGSTGDRALVLDWLAGLHWSSVRLLIRK